MMDYIADYYVDIVVLLVNC